MDYKKIYSWIDQNIDESFASIAYRPQGKEMDCINMQRKAPNHHKRSRRSEYYPPVPNDRRIGEPVWMMRGGQRTILTYEDGEPIRYGDRIWVTEFYGHEHEYVFLYNALMQENQLFAIINFPHLHCKCLHYKDSWEEGVSLKFGMRFPKLFKEQYYCQWWDYIHNSYNSKKK